MPALSLDRISTRVRREIRQITVGSESTVTQQDWLDKAASRFWDDHLDAMALEAAIHVVDRVRAEFLPELVATADPDDRDGWPELTRFLARRMRIGTKRLRRYRLGGLESFVAGNMALSETGGAFTIEHGECRIFGGTGSGTENPPLAEVGVVEALATVDDLGDIFESAVVYRVAAEALALLGMATMADSFERMATEEIMPFAITRGSRNRRREREQEEEEA